MNLVVLVHNVESIQNLLDDEPDRIFWNLSRKSLDHAVKIASIHPLHQQVKSLHALEGLEDLDDLRVLCACHVLKCDLGKCVFKLVLVCSRYDFHCEMLLRSNMFAEVDDSKRAFADNIFFLEEPEGVSFHYFVTNGQHLLVELHLVLQAALAGSRCEVYPE